MSKSTHGGTDRLGNPIDRNAGYARGEILRDTTRELARMAHGRAIIRDRMLRLGRDSIFDLSGLPRSFPLSSEDVEQLRSHITFQAALDGTAEALAVHHMGGNEAEHEAVMLNRVSAAILAICTAYLQPGDQVLSVVPSGRSHSSIRRSAAVAGAQLTEVVGAEELHAALREHLPRLVIITATTPQKFVMAEEDLRAVIALAHEAGAIVLVDDAHLVTRTVHHGQATSFALGPVDLAVCATDKLMNGPRAGVLAGRSELIRNLRGHVVQLGLEAPNAHYAAAARALEQFDPEPIKRAGRLAQQLLPRLRQRYGAERVYEAGPGIAISENDAVGIVRARASQREVRLVPVEICSAIGMAMTGSHGIVTTQTIGMPGNTPTLRITLFPDGERCPLDVVEEALDQAIARVADVLDDLPAASLLVCGDAHPGR